jgi:dipeptidyl aminopeptidase/acylaminoacyl peptidase
VSGIYAGSLDDPPERQSKKRILASSLGAYFVPSEEGGSGWLLFLRGSTLVAQPFDPSGLNLRGDPVTVAEGVGSAYQTGLFTAATNGLVYRASAITRDVQLTWFDRRGKPAGTVGEPGQISYLRMSPDGSRVVYQKETADQNNSDIWILDLKKDATTRFTFGPGASGRPVWSPDGSEIVFGLKKDKFWDLYRKPSNGAQQEELLLASNEHKEPLSLSRDGRFLLYATSRNESSAEEDLWVLPLQGNRTPYPFLATKFDEREATFSPDGRWVAYVSNESGPNQVYVREFKESPAANGAGGKWMASKDDGYFPLWKADATELLYISRFAKGQTLAPNTVQSVPVEVTATFQSGAPRQLFALPTFGWMAPTPDFQRFLVRVPVENKAPQAFTVLLNWESTLKSR